MHPSESNLALYAGGDLGWWERFRLSRHLANCPRCSRCAEEFRAVREWMQSQEELPDGVEWEPLAAELKANIRLGLAAGRCVAEEPREAVGFRWRSAAFALPVLLIVVAGWLSQSWPGPLRPPSAISGSSPVLRADPMGIEVQQNGRAFALMHPRGAGIVYSVSGPGVVRARYLDSETGYVTISHVYAE